MRIGIDIMGGDYAPQKTVHGAILALDELPNNTDIVLFCTHSFAIRHELEFVEIPAELPTMENFLIWHLSDDMDGAHIWMRNLLIEAYKNAKGMKI